jgi:hypothetical protein
MASRREALNALGLSPPLLALVTGEVCHPAIPHVCRLIPPEGSQPRDDEPAGLVPLWEDAGSSPEFFETVYAKPTPGGPVFWSVIFDQYDREPDPGGLFAHSEQGLLFWLFSCFYEHQERESTAGWDLPSLAATLGFHYLDEVLAFRRACSAMPGLDDDLRDVVRDIPAGPRADVTAESERLFAEGEGLVDQGCYVDALTRFRAAWDLLPEPKAGRELAVRLLAAVGDCYFHLRDWEACHEAMQDALRCGADVANPFLRLRLGQSLYELGNEREAANWLLPVYLTEGRKPFAGDDPKYLEFFRAQLRPPEGGWPEGW